MNPGCRESHLLFRSQGRTGLINGDGSGLRYLTFDIPGQVTWSAVDTFSDGRRILLSSMGERQDGPGRPFDEYYHRTRVRIWIYDIESEVLLEIEDGRRTEPFNMPLLVLPGQDRILFQVVKAGRSQIFSMDLEGNDRQEFTRDGEGFPYGLSVSSNGERIAFHVSGPPPHNYRIFTANLDGSGQTLIAGEQDHLYFGPSWSPDGEWLLYCDIHPREDPGHDWADLCIARPDGSEHRTLTEGAPHWMSAAYGTPGNSGNGSNLPRWISNSSVLYSRRQPDTNLAWQFDAGLPDDHFQRTYKPEQARGGAHLCVLDIESGILTPVNEAAPLQWNFRALPSPDGQQLAFCRAATSESPGLWIADSEGINQRLLTRGFEDLGVEHPLWMTDTRQTP